jgi:uncharacterized membrane protein YkvA (DUF1232 family)
VLTKLKTKARDLKVETYALYLVSKDSRVSWWKRLFLGIVIGYAVSPIDLIPDFIPVLGYLDDLILVPIGIFIALKLIPDEVLEDCRKQAKEEERKDMPIGKKTSLLILVIWMLGLITLLIWVIKWTQIL